MRSGTWGGGWDGNDGTGSEHEIWATLLDLYSDSSGRI